MGEIVNLRRVRKRKARQQEEAAANQNRAVFGRAKGERRLTESQRAHAEAKLDGVRIARPDAPDAG